LAIYRQYFAGLGAEEYLLLLSPGGEKAVQVDLAMILAAAHLDVALDPANQARHGSQGLVFQGQGSEAVNRTLIELLFALCLQDLDAQPARGLDAGVKVLGA